MPTIIVSYRRDDTRWITGRIVDRLERDYGKGQVFMDIDAIRPGTDFREHLQNVLGGCDVLLAIIGPHWFGADEAGRARLDDPADWVRVEIETALAKKVPVIPVLIDRTRMPKTSELPESMREFAYRQAADLDTGKDFHRHMDHLVGAITESVARRQQPATPSPAPATGPTQPPVKPDNWIDLETALSPQPKAAPLHTASKAPVAQSGVKAPPPRPQASTRGMIADIAAPPRADPRKMIGLALLLMLAAVGAVIAVLGPQSLYQRFFPSATQTQTAGPIVEPFEPKAPAAPEQRAVLYDEDTSDPNGKRYSGSTRWQVEKVTAGKESDVAIKADIQIPERQLSLTWSLRRNTDKSLPATHTIEIVFNVPSGSPSGGIENVPGVLMKSSEQTRGVPLAGLAVKVTGGFFLIGLSDKEPDKTNNIALLKDRGWLDIPIVYTNNRRAILAVEKGSLGEEVFRQVFAAWEAGK